MGFYDSMRRSLMAPLNTFPVHNLWVLGAFCTSSQQHTVCIFPTPRQGIMLGENVLIKPLTETRRIFTKWAIERLILMNLTTAKAQGKSIRIRFWAEVTLELDVGTLMTFFMDLNFCTDSRSKVTTRKAAMTWEMLLAIVHCLDVSVKMTPDICTVLAKLTLEPLVLWFPLLMHASMMPSQVAWNGSRVVAFNTAKMFFTRMTTGNMGFQLCL